MRRLATETTSHAPSSSPIVGAPAPGVTSEAAMVVRDPALGTAAQSTDAAQSPAALPSTDDARSTGTKRSTAPAHAIGARSAVDASRSSAAVPRLGCGDDARLASWQRRRGATRAALRAVLARGDVPFARLERLVTEAGAPRCVALVAAIESGLRRGARGRRGERGLWQLKPDQARRLGLVVTAARDDRLDVELATRAAARHMLALRARYDDWPLALAAYAAGEGRVARALQDRRGAKLWQLADEGRLPKTARNFVANVFLLVRAAVPEECGPPVTARAVEL